MSREQAHYLGNVMRLKAGASIVLFDGRNGAWAADLLDLGKRGAQARCTEQVAPQRDPPDLWVLFAPIKKARTDFIVEKSVELGAARILPVRTDHTNSERIRRDRLQAHAVEAAEQCGGTFVPEVADIQPLAGLLDGWRDRALIFADETLSDDPDWAEPGTEEGPLPPAPAAILIGPEGGFSAAERARLRAMRDGAPMRLGPRILRADTAAVAALTLWQAAQGDWR